MHATTSSPALSARTHVTADSIDREHGLARLDAADVLAQVPGNGISQAERASFAKFGAVFARWVKTSATLIDGFLFIEACRLRAS